jgi:hypothetical protein
MALLEVEPIPASLVQVYWGGTRDPWSLPHLALGGGVLAGDPEAWSLFSREYQQLVVESHARGKFVGKDQDMFLQLLVERRVPMVLYKRQSTKHTTVWYSFLGILSGTLPALVDERFDVNPGDQRTLGYPFAGRSAQLAGERAGRDGSPGKAKKQSTLVACFVVFLIMAALARK